MTATKPLRSVATLDDISIAALVDSFEIHLSSGVGGTRGIASPKTVRIYTDTAREFARWLADNDHPVIPARVTREHVAAYIAWLTEARKLAPASVNQRYRSLFQFFNFLLREEEISQHPMKGFLRPPKVPDAPPPVIEDKAIRALFATCAGKSFDDRRDLAILRLLRSAGPRVGEVAAIRYLPGDPDSNDIDIRNRVVRVRGKGNKWRWLPLSEKTALALDSYLRARARHPRAALPNLWLGQRGPFSVSGIEQMLRKRAARAGISGRMYPHLFRHTATHKDLANGMLEGDVMRLRGWSSRQMLDRYGRSAADERARQAFWRLQPGDDL